jgi:uncharacterized protein YoxC
MWNIQLHPHQFLRRRSFGTPQVALCLLAFGVTASAVCHWGAMNWTPEDSGPKLVAAANDLAERQANELHEAWKTRAKDVCQKASKAVERTRKEHEKCTARLEAFQRQMRQTAEAAAKQQAAARIQEKPKQQPPVENPAWLELDRKLAKLKQSRDRLLVDRTPIHPAVREVADSIEEVQRQMAAVPRQIPNSKPQNTEKVELPVIDPNAKKAADLLAKENQRKLNELTVAEERTRQAMEKAALGEQKAVQESQNEPQFAVEPVRIEIPPYQVDRGWQRLLWTTLMASVLMTLGVGSVSMGAGIEPPASKLAEVQADLDVPIVGVIPSSDPLPTADVIERQWRIRRASIAIGLLLMVVCPVVAFLGVAGM